VRYEVAYLDGTGTQRWKTCDRLTKAREPRAELVTKVAAGETIPDRRAMFSDVAEQWFEAKAPRLRPRTRAYYRRALDLVLLPRFGRARVTAVDADAVARLIRDLERHGLHAIDRSWPNRPLGRSSIENYLKPLQGILGLAVRRKLIPSSPFDVLTPDERAGGRGARGAARLDRAGAPRARRRGDRPRGVDVRADQAAARASYALSIRLAAPPAGRGVFRSARRLARRSPSTGWRSLLNGRGPTRRSSPVSTVGRSRIGT
jgi:hypothetical protein